MNGSVGRTIWPSPNSSWVVRDWRRPRYERRRCPASVLARYGSCPVLEHGTAQALVGDAWEDGLYRDDIAVQTRSNNGSGGSGGSGGSSKRLLFLTAAVAQRIRVAGGAGGREAARHLDLLGRIPFVDRALELFARLDALVLVNKALGVVILPTSALVPF